MELPGVQSDEIVFANFVNPPQCSRHGRRQQASPSVGTGDFGGFRIEEPAQSVRGSTMRGNLFFGHGSNTDKTRRGEVMLDDHVVNLVVGVRDEGRISQSEISRGGLTQREVGRSVGEGQLERINWPRMKHRRNTDESCLRKSVFNPCSIRGCRYSAQTPSRPRASA
jgi:hypothetical protein